MLCGGASHPAIRRANELLVQGMSNASLATLGRAAHFMERACFTPNALRRGQYTGAAVRSRFPGLFAAAADASPECLAALAALVSERGMVALVEAEPQPKIAGVRAEPYVIW